MATISERKKYIFLFDYLCGQLVHDMALPKHDKGQFDWITKVIESDDIRKILEELVNSIDSTWLALLATVCPYLTPPNRHLAILLYLGFAPESIVFINERKNMGALYTAKTRLKNAILASQSPQASTLLNSLGFKP